MAGRQKVSGGFKVDGKVIIKASAKKVGTLFQARAKRRMLLLIVRHKSWVLNILACAGYLPVMITVYQTISEVSFRCSLDIPRIEIFDRKF